MISQIANTWYDRRSWAGGRMIYRTHRTPRTVSTPSWGLTSFIRRRKRARVHGRWGDRNGIAVAAAVNEVVDRRVVDRSPYPSAGSYGSSEREGFRCSYGRRTLSYLSESLPFGVQWAVVAQRWMRSAPQWWLNAGFESRFCCLAADFNDVVTPITTSLLQFLLSDSIQRNRDSSLPMRFVRSIDFSVNKRHSHRRGRVSYLPVISNPLSVSQY